jgi:hypothetical protein
MSIVRLFQAFTKQGDRASANDYFLDLSHGEFLGSLSLAILTLIVGDCVMVSDNRRFVPFPQSSLNLEQIYRLRTVFKYNQSTTVFPVCCLFGFIGE